MKDLHYQLRPMNIDDIDQVIEGEKRAFGHTFGYDMLYQELTLNPFSHYIVLEINDEVRGYIGLSVDENMEIINFYVDPLYQNQGFGSMMLDFVMELCNKSHIKNISLEVRESNQKAIHLYQKYQFKQVAIRKGYYNNGENALLMVHNFEVKE